MHNRDTRFIDMKFILPLLATSLFSETEQTPLGLQKDVE
jgi:hypothetical protein